MRDMRNHGWNNWQPWRLDHAHTTSLRPSLAEANNPAVTPENALIVLRLTNNGPGDKVWLARVKTGTRNSLERLTLPLELDDHEFGVSLAAFPHDEMYVVSSASRPIVVIERIMPIDARLPRDYDRLPVYS